MKRGSGSLRWRLLLLVALAPALVVWADCSSRRAAKHPNVVLIVVDALRPDFLGCYGYDRPTSPNIDRLAAEGILFETTIAQAPWTKPSFATMFTSLYPFQHGVVDWEAVMPDTVETLAELLGSQGYATAAVINMLGITGQFKVTKGFDTVSEMTKGERDGTATADDAIDIMRKSRRPFFIVIHLFDTHWPYRPNPQYQDLVMRPGDSNPLAAVVGGPKRGGGRSEALGQQAAERDRLLYAGCVRSMDEGVGRVVKYLDDAGLRRNTLIVVTADHGEAFWEHGAGTHGNTLYDEAIKVPLVLNHPARYHGPQRIGGQVRHVDLLPTIVGSAGAKDSRHREGVSLLPLVETGKRLQVPGKILPQDEALSEISLRKAAAAKCLRTEAWKVVTEPMTGLVSAFDLGADPGETVDLWSRHPAAADSLMRDLGRIPGTSIRGWRLALSGGLPSPPGKVRITAPQGARVTAVEGSTGRDRAGVTVGGDSTFFEVGSAGGGSDSARVVFFDFLPDRGAVALDYSPGRGRKPDAVRVGADARRPVSAEIRVTAGEASGLPGDFKALRDARTPGIFLWWLPGVEWRPAGKQAPLTAEQKRRLRALGYVQ